MQQAFAARPRYSQTNTPDGIGPEFSFVGTKINRYGIWFLGIKSK
jgi:hypothetical protein